MPVDERFNMKIIKSTRVVKTERRPAPLRRVNVKPTTAEIVRAFRRSPGYKDILARIPKGETVAGWERATQVAYVSVWKKSGSAKYLDLWDCDHFDFASDVQKSINDCGAWFSHKGFATWGSKETATGRINCFFTAAAAGFYSCVVQLQGNPSATVECLIDNSSFGNLPFSGTIVQPHFSNLSAGNLNRPGFSGESVT